MSASTRPIMMTPLVQTDAAMSAPSADAQVLRQVAVGDGSAFETLYQRYAPRVRAYLCKRMSKPEQVDEVPNDVMIVIWQKAASCPANAPLLAWLYGIARHMAYRSARALKRQEVKADESIPVEENPEFYLLREDQNQALARAIFSLPQHERRPIELLVYHARSYKDIAMQLDIPVNTVKAQVMRGRRRLAAAMAS